MDLVAEGPHDMSLATARFPQEEQDPPAWQARRLAHPADNPLELLPGAAVDRLHVEGVVLPDIRRVGKGMKQLRDAAQNKTRRPGGRPGLRRPAFQSCTSGSGIAVAMASAFPSDSHEMKRGV